MRHERVHPGRAYWTPFQLQTSTWVIDLGGRELILGIDRDVTESKRMEAALAEERNLLRTLIDNLPDYIYVKDNDARYLASNFARARFLGASSPEEIIGKTDHALSPRELTAQSRDDERPAVRPAGLS